MLCSSLGFGSPFLDIATLYIHSIAVSELLLLHSSLLSVTSFENWNTEQRPKKIDHILVSFIVFRYQNDHGRWKNRTVARWVGACRCGTVLWHLPNISIYACFDGTRLIFTDIFPITCDYIWPVLLQCAIQQFTR